MGGGRALIYARAGHTEAIHGQVEAEDLPVRGNEGRGEAWKLLLQLGNAPSNYMP
jgi:hypothetical protein